MRVLQRSILVTVLAAGLVVGALLGTAGSASAAAPPSGGVTVVSPAPPTICLYGNCAEQPFTSGGVTVPGPPPACSGDYCIPQTPVCSSGYCIPQSWYIATSVLTNEGLYQLGTPVEGQNPTPVDNPSCVGLSQTVSGSLSATLSGSFGVSGEAVSGAVAQIQPGVQATVGYSYTFSGNAPCPAETNTTIYFGIGYVQTTGTVYTLSVTGQITSQSGVVATVPTGWSYYTQYTPAVTGS